MSQRRAFACLAVAVALADCGGSSPRPREPAREHANARPPLAAWAQAQLSGRVGSAVVALVNGGAVQWRFGMGSLDARGGPPPDPALAVYRIGSITKLVTGTALLRLQQEGRLDLDDPVARWVPELAPRLEGVTLRHLLNHTSGIPTTGNGSAPFWRQTPPTEAAMLHALDTPSSFAPGTQSVYSNAAVALAGLVVARAAGMPYRAFVQSRVLAPLGMRTVAWERATVPASRLAIGVGIGGAIDVPHWQLGAFESVGGIYATIDDMAGLARLAFGDAPGVLSAASVREALVDSPVPGPYGVSWRIGDIDGERSATHSGSTQDYSATLLVLPDARIAAVVLATGSEIDAIECVAAGMLRGVRSGRVPAACDRPVLDDAARAAAGQALLRLREFLNAPVDAGLAATFAPGYLGTVPRHEIDAATRMVAARFGRCDRQRVIAAGGLGVRAELGCERGIVHLEVRLEEVPPHRIEAVVSPDLM